jgi:hypothetical protein
MNDVTKSIKYPQGFLNNAQVISGQNPPIDNTQGYYVITASNQYGNASALTGGNGDLNPPNAFWCKCNAPRKSRQFCVRFG